MDNYYSCCLIGAVIGYFVLKEGAPRDSAAGIIGSGMGCLVALKFQIYIQ
mgnify:CR=1